MSRSAIIMLLCLFPVVGSASNIQEDGIRFNINASKELNMFDNVPHATVLAVYQFETLEGIKRLSKDKNGLNVLLKGEKFSKDVISVRREVIAPGKSLTFYWDRHKAAKYVAAVGGFFLADSSQMVKIIAIKEKERSPFFWMPSDPEKADSVIELNLTKRSLK